MPKTQTDVQDLPEDYRLTELGPLPEEWRVVRLGEVVNLQKGRKPKRLVEHPSPRALPYLTANYFRTGSPNAYVLHKDISSLPTCNHTDIVMIWDGSKAGQVFTGLQGVLASTMVRIDIKDHIITKEFLFFLLSSKFGLFNSQTTGSTIPHVSKTLFQSLPIPLPPLPEQRAIAHVLRRVQEAREATERVIAALRDLKRSLMRHLFTYGPVPVDAADQVELQDTPAGPIPAHWRVVRLGELWKQGILWIKNGFPQGRFNEQGKGVPHLRPFNVNDSGRVSLHQIKFVPPPPDNSPYWLRIGDIIFNNTNSEALVGKVAFFDLEGRFVLSNHMIIVRVQNPRVLNNVWLAGWLLYLWHQGFTQTLARRHVNQASISLARLKSIPIPLPPLDEQREIARILQTVDRKIEAEEARKEALDALFRSLLHHLMTAKIRLPANFIARFEEVSNHE